MDRERACFRKFVNHVNEPLSAFCVGFREIANSIFPNGKAERSASVSTASKGFNQPVTVHSLMDKLLSVHFRHGSSLLSAFHCGCISGMLAMTVAYRFQFRRAPTMAQAPWQPIQISTKPVNQPTLEPRIFFLPQLMAVHM